MKVWSNRISLTKLTLILALALCFHFATAQTTPQFNGRFGAGVYAYYPELGDNTVEPSFRGLVTAEHLFTESIHGAIDARVRRDVTNNVERTRVYELWLGWMLQTQWEIQAGRLGNRGFGGVGFLDGSRLIYSPQKTLELSLYGGNEPDLNSFGFGKDVTKFGVAAQGHTETNTANWGVSLLQQQYQGVLDRRMLTQNLTFLPSPRTYVYQSAELDFAYRDNGKDVNGLRVSDLHINASEPVGNDWRFNQSAGFRRGFKMLRSMRDIADTLFETDPVYDMSGGVNWRLHPQLNLRGDVRYQRREKTNEDGISGGGGLSANTTWMKPLYGFFDVRYNNNLYYAGTSYTISFEQEVLHRLSPRIGYTTERNEYRSGYGGGSNAYNRNEAEVSLWYWLDSWSAGVTADIAKVNDSKENRFLFDLGYRIPTVH